MLLVGLTGSIAMGKSTVARMFALLGAPVFDADAAVRDFYAGPGASAVESMFPGVLGSGGVDRERLAKRVLGDREALKALESVVHPEVAKARSDFLSEARARMRRVAVVDVPLLFETRADTAVDVVAVVSAREEHQRERAMRREGMTKERFEHILSHQIPDAEKRRRAHVVIDSSAEQEETRSQVRQLLRALCALEGR